jgi:Spy/CpxP family protein refolding chaperone
MKAFRMIMLAAVLIVFGAAASAQQGPLAAGPMGGQSDDDVDFEAGPGRSGPGVPLSEERREEIRKKVEAYRIVRLTEELKLDSQAAMKLAALLGSADKKRWELTREKRETMMEIQTALRSGSPDERKLKAALDRLDRNHREMMDIREKEMKGLRDILTVEQRARYTIFQREFMREMRGRMAGARGGQGPAMRGGPGRGGMGPGTGPGPGTERSPQ